MLLKSKQNKQNPTKTQKKPRKKTPKYKSQQETNRMFCELSLLNTSLLTEPVITGTDTELLNQFVNLEEELIRNNQDEITINQ